MEALSPERSGAELAYDDLVRDVVTGGGRLLVVQTNDATFGRSGETEQQLAVGRLRAVEHVLVHDVPVRSGWTLATRAGGLPEAGLSLLGLLALGVAARGERRP